MNYLKNRTMEKNFETLEVGRRYWNGRGEVVKIVHDDGHENYPFDDEDERSYTPEGNVWCYKGTEHDLIKLLPEEPTRSLAELEAKRAELDKEIEELKKNTQTFYCQAFFTRNDGKTIILEASATDEQRREAIEELIEDGQYPSIATFDLPFQKVDGKWEPAFKIVPK